MKLFKNTYKYTHMTIYTCYVFTLYTTHTCIYPPPCLQALLVCLSFFTIPLLNLQSSIPMSILNPQSQWSQWYLGPLLGLGPPFGLWDGALGLSFKGPRPPLGEATADTQKHLQKQKDF